MIPIETATAFFAASVVLALAPGPDNIFVLTQSALNGKLAGLLVTFGLCTGLIVHTTAVAFGIAAIFKASSLAFLLLKYAGVCYLIYLAWGAFRAPETQMDSAGGNEIQLHKLYLRGIIMNVTNPKVSIFFLAFLPQFADPSRGSLPVQIIALGGLFIIATILIFGSIALVSGFLGEWFNRSGKAQIALNRVAGTIFVALAIKLATARQ